MLWWKLHISFAYLASHSLLACREIDNCRNGQTDFVKIMLVQRKLYYEYGIGDDFIIYSYGNELYLRFLQNASHGVVTEFFSRRYITVPQS